MKTETPLIYKKLSNVSFESPVKMHVGYHFRELSLYPPDGYKFLTSQGLKESLLARLSKYSWSFPVYEKLSDIIPLVLYLAYLQKWTKKKPAEADLIYSAGLIFRPEPWVIEIDSLTNLIGMRHVRFFQKYKGLIEREFALNYCKGIFFHSDFARNIALSNLNSSEFVHKMITLPRAVHKKNANKIQHEGIKLLFVGSANASGEFELRGGKEVLEAFTILVEKHKDIQLVIRSDVPNRLKSKYRNILQHPNVRLIEHILPWEELEAVYQSADIFLFPGYYDCWLIMVEAMSYGLPIVATDVLSVRGELVEDGKNGLIIQRAKDVPYFKGDFPCAHLRDAEWLNAIYRSTASDVVEDLVDKTSKLIENEQLRHKMGQAGRWEVEQGRFSIERRNKVLKEVFDKAIGR